MKNEALINLCYQKSIILDNEKAQNTIQKIKGKPKYKKKELISFIQQKHLDMKIRERSWALEERLRLESPMLCATYKHLKKEEQQIIVANDNHWIAERKWNGNRMIIFYHPEYGFSFFSRNISDLDLLPIEYHNLLITDNCQNNSSLNNYNINNITYIPPSWFKNKFKIPFIIDSEVVASKPSLDLSILPRNALKVQKEVFDYTKNISTELNAASAMLQYNTADSHLLQQQNPLIFKCFDLIMFNNQYLYTTQLHLRMKYLKEILSFLPKCFQISDSTNIDKIKFYENIIENKGEGVVFKNIYSPYNYAGTRHANEWVKLKRSMTSNLKDIDAFVTGFNLGNKGTKNEFLIGSLELSLYLRDKNGLLKLHKIATVANFTDEFREMITDKDDPLNPKLREELYNKVFSINGMSVSSREMVLNHAILESLQPRYDKSCFDCILDESILIEHIV